ncbi:MAG: hypothetical protein R3F33_05475 [Planctomycetota bacterium]
MSVLACLALALPGSLSPLGDAVQVELSQRTFRTFQTVLPGDPFRNLGEGFDLPASFGGHFAVDIAGDGLDIDADGDGSLETHIEGIADKTTGERFGRVVLQAPGHPAYAVRLRDLGKGWQWACGGAMVGSIDGLKVQLFDANGNGTYGDFGEDAICIGGRSQAGLLSKTMHLNGVLHNVAVSEDGSRLTLDPYAGETGRLNLEKKLQCEGKLLSALVQSLDGKHCFEMAGEGEGLDLPAGTYRLLQARLGLGKATVEVQGDAVRPMAVNAGEEQELSWGAPIRAEFEYTYEGGQLTFDPNKVWLTGAAGERYVGWAPKGKSPEFTVIERNLGTELTKALFPGSC